MKKRLKNQSLLYNSSPSKWRKIASLLVIIFILSCESRTLNPAPKVLLPEDKMEDILYDLSLLNALHASRFPKQGKDIFNQKYLFKKHGLVDSVWIQNQQYYAQDPKRLQLIYRRIDVRIKKALDSLDQLIAQDKEEKKD